MNRLEMRETMRVLLGETIEDFYKDIECNKYLSVGQLKVASTLLCLQTHKNVETVAFNDPLLDADDSRREGRYGLPDDFLSLKDVQIKDGADWYPLTRWNYDDYKMYARNASGGRPTAYKPEFGSTSQGNPAPGDLWFWPYPDRSSPDQYVYQVSFFQKPTPLDEDEDISELMESAHLAVCYHAAMTLSRKGKDRALIQELSALWGDEIAMLKDLVGLSDQTGDIRMKNYYSDDCD